MTPSPLRTCSIERSVESAHLDAIAAGQSSAAAGAAAQVAQQLMRRPWAIGANRDRPALVLIAVSRMRENEALVAFAQHRGLFTYITAHEHLPNGQGARRGQLIRAMGTTQYILAARVLFSKAERGWPARPPHPARLGLLRLQLRRLGDARRRFHLCLDVDVERLGRHRQRLGAELGEALLDLGRGDRLQRFVVQAAH